MRFCIATQKRYLSAMPHTHDASATMRPVDHRLNVVCRTRLQTQVELNFRISTILVKGLKRVMNRA
eukprot:scaffold162087_cov18-Prasinocladus_malaysianus.AAC.1